MSDKPVLGELKLTKTDSTLFSDLLISDQTSSTGVPYRDVPIFSSNRSLSVMLVSLNFQRVTR